MNIRFLSVVLCACLILSCAGPSLSQEGTAADPILKELKAKYAPDSRVNIFAVEASQKGNGILLKGQTNHAAAKAELLEKLKGKKVIDNISVLPEDSGLGDKIYALVNNSVANLRSNPKHSAELATQSTLGTPLKVYEKRGDFYRVQTPDGYIAWVDHGGIVNLNLKDLETYINAPQLIYQPVYGFAYANTNLSGPPVADLVAGALLQQVASSGNTYQVKFPDGREAFIPKSEAIPMQSWLDQRVPNPTSLVELGKQFTGFPYLWGGTSSKGMDCSGFTKTVYFMHGLVLPRDASQQVHAGTLVDDKKDWSKLQKGDLLFFGRVTPERERVVHVGMWIGDMSFIHASGKIRISSFDPKSPNYDEFNLNRYLRTKRMIQQEDEKIRDLRKEKLLKL